MCTLRSIHPRSANDEAIRSGTDESEGVTGNESQLLHSVGAEHARVFRRDDTRRLDLVFVGMRRHDHADAIIHFDPAQRPEKGIAMASEHDVAGLTWPRGSTNETDGARESLFVVSLF